MFNNKKEGYEGTTVIAEGVNVQGEFRGDGPMIIDGTMQGTISTSKNIDVGANADIEADIKAGSMVVAGKIKGNIIAADRLELLTGSRIDGDVTTRSLVIAEGAILNGRCSMNVVATEEAEEKIEIPKAKPSRERIA